MSTSRLVLLEAARVAAALPRRMSCPDCDPCYLNNLVGSAQCNPAVVGSPCSPLSRAEP